jgi:hypothetical protein
VQRREMAKQELEDLKEAQKWHLNLKGFRDTMCTNKNGKQLRGHRGAKPRCCVLLFCATDKRGGTPNKQPSS